MCGFREVSGNFLWKSHNFISNLFVDVCHIECLLLKLPNTSIFTYGKQTFFVSSSMARKELTHEIILTQSCLMVSKYVSLIVTKFNTHIIIVYLLFQK